MSRITDTWTNASGRSRAAVLAVAAALLILLLTLTVFGADATPLPIPGAGDSGAVQPAAPDGPTSAHQIPPAGVPANTIAPLNVSPGPDAEAAAVTPEAVAQQTRAIEEAMNPGVAIPSAADAVGPEIAAAGARLEAAAQAYGACIARLAKAQQAKPPSCGRDLPEGVYADRRVNHGFSLAIDDVDGHRVRYLVRDGVVCRALDDKPDCTAWTAAVSERD